MGQRRTDNQDTFICTTIWSDTSALLAAIDGVGGYAGGDRAAAIAKESIERYMATPNGDPLSMLREAVVFANNQINTQRQQELRLAQMCCVLTAAVADVSLGKLYFVHVGDTRLYRYRQGMLEKLTRDHSMVGIREDANELTEAEAMQHPRRNEILREVGSTAHRVDDADFLESGETDFLPGDRLLLCSDGLTDMITQAQIVAVLSQSLPLKKQSAELIRLANKQGGNDNITVVLATNTKPSTKPVSPTVPAKADTGRTQEQATVPVSSVSPPVRPVDAIPAKRSMAGVWIVLGLLLVGVIGGIVWYQQPSVRPFASPVDSVNTVNGQTNAVPAVLAAPSRLDSLVQLAYRSKDHRLILPGDTLRLDKPLILNDSLQAIVGNRLTVLVPADTSRVSVAIQVTRPGAISLENLVIRGFKTGIETTGGGQLHLTNVYFRGVDLPVRAAIRQDTCRNTVITVSVQNQLVLPQTPRH